MSNNNIRFCKYFKENGFCKYKDDCIFSHNCFEFKNNVIELNLDINDSKEIKFHHMKINDDFLYRLVNYKNDKLNLKIPNNTICNYIKRGKNCPFNDKCYFLHN